MQQVTTLFTKSPILHRSIAILAIIIAAMLVFFASPRPLSVRNQIAVVRMLTNAHADWEARPNREVTQAIVLPNGIRLEPEREQVIEGYRITAHIRSPRFAVEACPLLAGSTGLFCFFLDYDGKLHFEPTLGKAASAETRPWRDYKEPKKN